MPGVGAASLGGTPLGPELRGGPGLGDGPPPPGDCSNVASIGGRVLGCEIAVVGPGSGPGIGRSRSLGRA